MNPIVVQSLKQNYDSVYATKEDKERIEYSILDNHFPKPTDQAVDIVASLLMEFFHDLPTPLVSAASVLEMMNIIETNDSESLNQVRVQLCTVLKQVATPMKECFALLLSFFRDVLKHRVYNKQSVKDLATCFISCFGRPSDDVLSSISVSLIELVENILKSRARFVVLDERLFKQNVRYACPVYDSGDEVSLASNTTQQTAASMLSRFGTMLKKSFKTGRPNYPVGTIRQQTNQSVLSKKGKHKGNGTLLGKLQGQNQTRLVKKFNPSEALKKRKDSLFRDVDRRGSLSSDTGARRMTNRHRGDSVYSKASCETTASHGFSDQEQTAPSSRLG